MKPTLIFRIAAFLMLLFAAGHTLGFRQVDPQWHANAVVDAMKSVRFPVQSFQDRSYWNFYVGFGLFVTVFELMIAVITWQLGGLWRREPSLARGMALLISMGYAASGWLSWQYFFAAPVIFSVLIFMFMLAAALSVRVPEAV